MAYGSRHMLHSLSDSDSHASLSLKAQVLWPMIIADCDDQGRFLTVADSVKWTFCPKVEAIDSEGIPGLLHEMATQRMILIYGSENQYAQILNWWKFQRPRWARPSRYPAPDGWLDRVNIRIADGTLTENWDTPGGFCQSDDRRETVHVGQPMSDTTSKRRVRDSESDSENDNNTSPNGEATSKRRPPDPDLKHWAWMDWKENYRNSRTGKTLKPPPGYDRIIGKVVSFAEEHGREAWQWLLRFWKQHNWDPSAFEKMMDRGKKEFANEAHRGRIGWAANGLTDEERAIYASGS